MGQLLPDRGPGWMGIRHHKQGTSLPSTVRRGSLLFCKGFGKVVVYCVNIKYLYCARRDDDVHQRMNANGLSTYDLFS